MKCSEGGRYFRICVEEKGKKKWKMKRHGKRDREEKS